MKQRTYQIKFVEGKESDVEIVVRGKHEDGLGISHESIIDEWDLHGVGFSMDEWYLVSNQPMDGAFWLHLDEEDFDISNKDECYVLWYHTLNSCYSLKFCLKKFRPYFGFRTRPPVKLYFQQIKP